MSSNNEIPIEIENWQFSRSFYSLSLLFVYYCFQWKSISYGNWLHSCLSNRRCSSITFNSSALFPHSCVNCFYSHSLVRSQHGRNSFQFDNAFQLWSSSILLFHFQCECFLFSIVPIISVCRYSTYWESFELLVLPWSCSAVVPQWLYGKVVVSFIAFITIIERYLWAFFIVPFLLFFS